MNDIKREMQDLELALKAMNSPTPNEARMLLHLTEDQFCKLLDIDKATYYAWVTGEKEMSINQRIFLKEAIRIAREKGFI